jgi:hypothetical protein
MLQEARLSALSRSRQKRDKIKASFAKVCDARFFNDFGDGVVGWQKRPFLSGFVL